MNSQLERSLLLYGEEGITKLKNSHVAVFGLGGVGCYVVEAFARSGIGEITIVDFDVYEKSNLNRQLYATTETIGVKKTVATANRIKLIAPNVKINVIDAMVVEETASQIDFSKFDYVVDAIDNVSGKVGIISECKRNNVNVISIMGTGNKTEPTSFKVEDISKTKVCPLCKAVRKQLKDRQIENVKVVYSEEAPKVSGKTVSSNSFIPAIAGLIASGTAINDLIYKENL